MKPLNLWSMLVLIPLALLLSGAEPNPQPRQIPSPRENIQNSAQSSGNQTQGRQDNHTPTAQPSADIRNTVETFAAQKDRGDVATEEKNKPKSLRIPAVNVNIDDFPAIRIRKDLADYAFLVFSALLVVVGALQFRLLKRISESDRPLLAVSNLIANQSPLSGFRPLVEFQNCGKNPAILIRAVAATQPRRRQIPECAPKPEYDKLPACTLERSILGAGDKTQIGWGIYVIQNEAERLLYAAGEWDFVVYGAAHYRAASGGRIYKTDFYWFYHPPSDLLPEGRFDVGPTPYNRQT